VIDFNFEFAEELLVDTSTDGEVHLRFNDRNLGIVSGGDSDGYMITNDWNNRHFTLGFNEDSILYHITREDLENEKSGRESISYAGYVAELYGYFRTIADAIPEDQIDWELVGVLDVEAARDYLKELDILEENKEGLRTDFENKNKIMGKFASNPSKIGELLNEVLDPVAFDGMRDHDESVFFRPVYGGVYILVPYSGEYVGVTTVDELHQVLLEGGQGSQIIDHVIRSIATD